MTRKRSLEGKLRGLRPALMPRADALAWIERQGRAGNAPSREANTSPDDVDAATCHRISPAHTHAKAAISRFSPPLRYTAFSDFQGIRPRSRWMACAHPTTLWGTPRQHALFHPAALSLRSGVQYDGFVVVSRLSPVLLFFNLAANLTITTLQYTPATPRLTVTLLHICAHPARRFSDRKRRKGEKWRMFYRYRWTATTYSKASGHFVNSHFPPGASPASAWSSSSSSAPFGSHLSSTSASKFALGRKRTNLGWSENETTRSPQGKKPDEASNFLTKREK